MVAIASRTCDSLPVSCTRQKACLCAYILIRYGADLNTYAAGKLQLESDSDPELSSESSPEPQKAEPAKRRGRGQREQPQEEDLDGDYQPISPPVVGPQE